MTRDIRPLTPDDLPELSRLLTAGFHAPPDADFAAPEVLRWKYLEPAGPVAMPTRHRIPPGATSRGTKRGGSSAISGSAGRSSRARRWRPRAVGCRRSTSSTGWARPSTAPRDEPDAHGHIKESRPSSGWGSARRRWWWASGPAMSCGASCRCIPASSAPGTGSGPADSDPCSAGCGWPATPRAGGFARPSAPRAPSARARFGLRGRDHAHRRAGQGARHLHATRPGPAQWLLRFPRQAMSGWHLLDRYGTAPGVRRAQPRPQGPGTHPDREVRRPPAR